MHQQNTQRNAPDTTPKMENTHLAELSKSPCPPTLSQEGSSEFADGAASQKSELPEMEPQNETDQHKRVTTPSEKDTDNPDAEIKQIATATAETSRETEIVKPKVCDKETKVVDVHRTMSAKVMADTSSLEETKGSKDQATSEKSCQDTPKKAIEVAEPELTEERKKTFFEILMFYNTPKIENTNLAGPSKSPYSGHTLSQEVSDKIADGAASQKTELPEMGPQIEANQQERVTASSEKDTDNPDAKKTCGIQNVANIKQFETANKETSQETEIVERKVFDQETKVVDPHQAMSAEGMESVMHDEGTLGVVVSGANPVMANTASLEETKKKNHETTSDQDTSKTKAIEIDEPEVDEERKKTFCEILMFYEEKIRKYDDKDNTYRRRDSVSKKPRSSTSALAGISKTEVDVSKSGIDERKVATDSHPTTADTTPLELREVSKGAPDKCGSEGIEDFSTKKTPESSVLPSELVETKLKKKRYKHKRSEKDCVARKLQIEQEGSVDLTGDENALAGIGYLTMSEEESAAEQHEEIPIFVDDSKAEDNIEITPPTEEKPVQTNEENVEHVGILGDGQPMSREMFLSAPLHPAELCPIYLRLPDIVKRKRYPVLKNLPTGLCDTCFSSNAILARVKFVNKNVFRYMKTEGVGNYNRLIFPGDKENPSYVDTTKNKRPPVQTPEDKYFGAPYFSPPPPPIRGPIVRGMPLQPSFSSPHFGRPFAPIPRPFNPFRFNHPPAVPLFIPPNAGFVRPIEPFFHSMTHLQNFNYRPPINWPNPPVMHQDYEQQAQENTDSMPGVPEMLNSDEVCDLQPPLEQEYPEEQAPERGDSALPQRKKRYRTRRRKKSQNKD